MASVASAIVPSGRMARMFAERLLVGVEPGTFARKPAGIDTNHPSFILGHLSLYPRKVMELVGAGDRAPGVPAGFEAVYAAGCTCLHDERGEIYPPMDTVVGYFFAATDAAIAAVEQAPDEWLLRAHSAGGRAATVLTTIGAAVGFYLGAHAMMHLGQFSAWRRCWGMPAAF